MNTGIYHFVFTIYILCHELILFHFFLLIEISQFFLSRFMTRPWSKRRHVFVYHNHPNLYKHVTLSWLPSNIFNASCAEFIRMYELRSSEASVVFPILRSVAWVQSDQDSMNLHQVENLREQYSRIERVDVCMLRSCLLWVMGPWHKRFPMNYTFKLNSKRSRNNCKPRWNPPRIRSIQAN